MHYKDVLAKMLEPKDKLGSVLDTFLAIGRILEARQKVKRGEYFSVDDLDKIINSSMFSLAAFPYWAAHGMTLRPLFLKAIYSGSDNFLQEFFIDAIPTALTTAMPHNQDKFPDYRKQTEDLFKKE